MTPLSRLRVRVSMAVRHRPFWIEILSAAQMDAWGIFVLSMREPLARVHSFSVLRDCPHANLALGLTAVCFGKLQLAAAILNFTIPRAVLAVCAMFVWWFLRLISTPPNDPHPGTVLYAGAIMANAFAFGWLFYDLLRER